MGAWPFTIVAQQVVGAAQAGHDFSRSTMEHAMTSAHTWSDIVLVVLGGVTVVVTTAYTVLYLVRPGEASADHIKRRILDDGGQRRR